MQDFSNFRKNLPSVMIEKKISRPGKSVHTVKGNFEMKCTKNALFCPKLGAPLPNIDDTPKRHIYGVTSTLGNNMKAQLEAVPNTTRVQDLMGR